MRISIFGLGYVGTVSAASFGRYGYTIIGVDTSETKVSLIDQGRSPIIEPDIDALLLAAHISGQLTATTDHHYAVLQSDVSLICVGTPSNDNGSLNLNQVFTVAAQIGSTLKAKQTYHVLALRSTVLPGTVEQVVSIIEKESGKKSGKDFGVASNPEFLREGSALQDFDNPPYTVVGSDDPQAVASLKELYSPIQAPFHAVKTKEAEILKYVCNLFHATKVVFANEMGTVAKQFGIDSHAVMNLFVADTKLNISPAYLKPGFSFGGSCLPKDVRAITYAAHSADIHVPLVESLTASNKIHTQRAIEWVIRQHTKKVGVLGLSFKPGTDDIRESPIVEVIETLIGKGYLISIYDTNVNLARLVGTNKRYIEHEIPHISSLMKNSPQEVLDFADVIVIAHRSAEFSALLSSLRPGQKVLDLVRLTDFMENLDEEYDGICW